MKFPSTPKLSALNWTLNGRVLYLKMFVPLREINLLEAYSYSSYVNAPSERFMTPAMIDFLAS
jgi:hypothetical protein